MGEAVDGVFVEGTMGFAFGSGIEPEETSFELTLNGRPLYIAYQPVKKEISYVFQQPLKDGPHQINFTVRDRFGNNASKTAFFSIY